MGATGRVGGTVEKALTAAGVPARVGLRTPEHWSGEAEAVRFDLSDASTYSALGGCTRLFLMWPPGTTVQQVGALVESAKQQGVQQVVFLSILGAEKLPILPHRRTEKLLTNSGLSWVFLRASYFMQNLSTVHRDDIRLRNELFLPAGYLPGHGRTSMVDAQDVGEVAALALWEGHRNRAYDLTGPTAPNYFEVAQVLSEELKRPVRYAHPGAVEFVRVSL